MNITEKFSETEYCNTVRINSSLEEIFLEFGVSIPTEKDLSVELNKRLAMNYFTAKRFALNLGNHLRAFEEEHGLIEINEVQK